MSFEHLEYEFQIDRKYFDRLLQKGVTHQQWLRIQQTDNYLRELNLRVKHEEVTKEERRKVAAMVKQESQDIWDSLFAGCLGETVKNFPDLSTEKRYSYAWNWAENLMLHELYAPPHFTKLARCIHCGPVLLSEKAIDTDGIHSCPWCAVHMLSRVDFKIEKVRRH